jgi:phosphoenolpyruvate phosphomutase
MHDAQRLRTLLSQPEIARLIGARDGLTARIAEETGFDGLWVSSFELSATFGLPDISLLGMTDYLAAAVAINECASIPVLADCDTGFGGRANIAHLVKRYESAGIAGVCIEDKTFPKRNSFLSGGQVLENAEEFAARIGIAKSAQVGEDFVVVARSESFIAGMGIDETMRRAHMYADMGADAVMVHSRKRGPEEIIEFLGRWRHRLPVIVVPTTYPSWTETEAEQHGVSMVIYANYGLRASVRAIREAMLSVIAHGAAAPLERSIASVAEIFDLVGMSRWEALQSDPTTPGDSRSIDPTIKTDRPA